MLAESGHALTDLALGFVAVVLAIGLQRTPAVHRHWRSALWWFGIAALAGAVHHGLIVRWPDVARPSWALISVLVVVAVSFMLAGTVHDVLGGRRTGTFWLLRSLGISAYVVIALTGHAGIQAMLACESLTMASILVLWIWAAYRGHPRAPTMLLAITASGAAAFTKLAGADLLGLDATSLYHLAQIPGLLLLFAAVGGLRVSRRPSGSRLVRVRSAP